MIYFQVTFTVDKTTGDGPKLKEIMRTIGTGILQEQFAKYIKTLKEGMYLGFGYSVVKSRRMLPKQLYLYEKERAYKMAFF